jgi:hypothetical protein
VAWKGFSALQLNRLSQFEKMQFLLKNVAKEREKKVKNICFPGHCLTALLIKPWIHILGDRFTKVVFNIRKFTAIQNLKL